MIGKDEGVRGDAIHEASNISIEYLSKAGFILMAFWSLKFASVYVAFAAALILSYYLAGKSLTYAVLRENNDSFDNLLHYFIVTLAGVFLVLGVII
jgi:hypothetical protein